LLWLDRPEYYKFIQFLLYRKGIRQWYVNEWIKARPGDSVLDIGRGPGTILEQLPRVKYLGLDTNPRYIKSAKRNYRDRGDFIEADASALPSLKDGAFDIVMSNGVLHHLDNTTVLGLMKSIRTLLKPGGRFVSLDGCYVDGQSFLSKTLLDLDRGSYVRNQEEYERLLSPFFSTIESVVKKDLLTVPYDIILMSAKTDEK